MDSSLDKGQFQRMENPHSVFVKRMKHENPEIQGDCLQLFSNSMHIKTWKISFKISKKTREILNQVSPPFFQKLSKTCFVLLFKTVKRTPPRCLHNKFAWPPRLSPLGISHPYHPCMVYLPTFG